MVDTQGAAARRRNLTRNGVPKFEARWLEEEACAGIVKNAWELEVDVKHGCVVEGVRGVLGELVGWSRNVLGDLEKRISKLKKELDGWRRKGIGEEQVRKEQVIRFKFSRLEEQRETYWKQRADVHWMKNGVRNTKYFHSVASERRKKNHIKKLRREDGVVVEEEEAMREGKHYLP
jgi:hypothetical protein